MISFWQTLNFWYEESRYRHCQTPPCTPVQVWMESRTVQPDFNLVSTPDVIKGIIHPQIIYSHPCYLQTSNTQETPNLAWWSINPTVMAYKMYISNFISTFYRTPPRPLVWYLIILHIRHNSIINDLKKKRLHKKRKKETRKKKKTGLPAPNQIQHYNFKSKWTTVTVTNLYIVGKLYGKLSWN